jgi:hypothetical protein
VVPRPPIERAWRGGSSTRVIPRVAARSAGDSDCDRSQRWPLYLRTSHLLF